MTTNVWLKKIQLKHRINNDFQIKLSDIWNSFIVYLMKKEKQYQIISRSFN